MLNFLELLSETQTGKRPHQTKCHQQEIFHQVPDGVKCV